MEKCNEPYNVDVLGKSIVVLPGVFYPASDTELLINSAKVKSDDKVLETFAGTGAISIFFAQFAKEVIAVDINPQAIKNIQENIKLHKLSKKMKAFQADIFPNERKFDVILINPPYADKEAKNLIEKAFFDKDHNIIKRFFKEAKNYLNHEGRIYSTWSNFADFEFIENLVKENKYSIVQIAETTKDMKVYRVYEIKP